MLKVCKSISTNKGVAPDLKIEIPVALKVKGVVMIWSVLSKYSLPLNFIERALSERRSASVPDATPLQYFTPI